MSDPTYERGGRKLEFRLSESVYAELLRQMTAAPIPTGFGLPWYVRRILSALPMPAVPPAFQSLVDAHVLAYIKRLSDSANAIAKDANAQRGPQEPTPDQLAGFRQALDDIVTYLVRIRPAGYVVAPVPTKRYRVRGLPLPVPAGVPTSDARLREFQNRRITINVSVAFAEEVQAKAMAFGGGRRGMLSKLLRAAIMGESLPPVRQGRRDPNDNYAYFYGSRLTGHFSQMIARAGPQRPTIPSSVLDLFGLRSCAERITAYAFHQADLSLQDRASLLIEQAREQRANRAEAQRVDLDSLAEYGL